MATPLSHPQSYLGQSLPKLAQDVTELQRMLTDEKMRCETHKTHYQTLKAEHTRLLDEYQRLENEMALLMEHKTNDNDQLKDYISKTSKNLVEKMTEIEQIKTGVITPKKLEVAKVKMSEEAEVPYKKHLQMMDQEVDQQRRGYNELRYEYSLLKAEHEHDKEEHARLLEEMKMKYEMEIKNLQRDREAAISECKTESSQDGQRVRVLQRENAQLSLKVKAVLAELEESRAQSQQASLHSQHAARLQSKQLAQHAANLKALEVEKESLRMQVGQLQKEGSSTLDSQQRVHSRVHELERENITLKSQLEETVHSSKLELTNLKMDIAKTRGELERERDTLAGDFEECKTKNEMLEKLLSSHTNALAENEKEIIRRVHEVREEEWEKINKIEKEKLELEAKLHEIERIKMEEETKKQLQREKFDEKIEESNKKVQEMEKECLVLRTKLEHSRNCSEQLEQEESITTELRDKLHQARTELQNLQIMDNDLNSQIEKQRITIDNLKSELQSARNDVEKVQEDAQSRIDQQKISWLDERQQLQDRIGDLDQQIQQKNQQLHNIERSRNKIKSQYAKRKSHFKNKIEILEAKKEEIELEKQALKENVPKELHTRVKKQLSELLRRHADFRSVLLLGDVTPVPIGEMTFASMSMMPITSRVEHSTPVIGSENQHLNDLKDLNKRLKNLDDDQRQQMNQLLGENIEVENISAVPVLAEDTDA